MSIINPGDFPIDAQTVDGVELAARLNRLYGAIHSNNAATARPASIQAGGIWSNTTAEGIELLFYDGTSDHVIGAVAHGSSSFGITGDKLVPVFNQASAYAVGDMIWNPTTGQFMTPLAPVAAGQPFNAAEWRVATSITEGLVKQVNFGVPIGMAAGQGDLIAPVGGSASGTAFWYRIGDLVNLYCIFAQEVPSGQYTVAFNGAAPARSVPFAGNEMVQAYMQSGTICSPLTVVDGTYSLSGNVVKEGSNRFTFNILYPAR